MTLARPAPIHETIINRATLAATTKHQYIRAIDRLMIAQVDPRNRESLAAYAGTLPASSRSFLKAALKLLFKEQVTTLKGSATPDNVNEIQAMLFNIESMMETIKTETPKGTKSHKWLTPGQVTDLTTEAANSNQGAASRRDWIALSLMLFGLRREEAVSLPFDKITRVPDGNGQPRPVIDVTGKGAKSRTVPISELLYTRLMEWQQEAGPGRVLRAITAQGTINHSLSGKSAYMIVQKYGDLIGIQDLQPHDLRRTYANLIWNNTQDLMLVMTLLGHDKPETTMRYLNLKLDLTRNTSQYIPLGG